MTPNELIPCPWCKGTDIIIIQIRDQLTKSPYGKAGFCRDCHAQGRAATATGWVESEEDARTAWNTRPIEELEAVAEAARDLSRARSEALRDAEGGFVNFSIALSFHLNNLESALKKLEDK